MSALEGLKTRLANYLAAEARILNSQEYQVGQGSTARRNRLAELAEVRVAIKELQGEIVRAQATVQGGRRITYLRPLDR